MHDNRNNYLIKTEPKEIDENEIFNIIKSSALLSGLESINTSRTIKSIGKWSFPLKYKKLNEKQINEIRNNFQIEIDGEDLQPPISTFEAMRFPEAILKALHKMEIDYPSPIQMQGIPTM